MLCKGGSLFRLDLAYFTNLMLSFFKPVDSNGSLRSAHDFSSMKTFYQGSLAKSNLYAPSPALLHLTVSALACYGPET